MEIKNELQIAWDKIRFQTVRVVCFPLPPVPTKHEKIVYMPDAFMSRVGDKDQRFTTGGVDQENILGTIMTENGPAIIVVMTLDELISLNIVNSHIHSHSHAICARVSFHPFVKEGDIQFVDKVAIDHLSFGGSCNRASHYVVPQAPYLTSLLQFRQCPKSEEFNGNNDELEYMIEKKIDYMSPQETELLFPWMNWHRNSRVDEFVSKCLVDINTSYYRVLTGLGSWAKPYLFNLRRNHLKKKEDLYASVCEGSLLI